MIEPLARGVDPVQLAFQSLVSMGTRTQRTESPLAVALDRLGVDLARGERFTTAEAKQFVGLVQATLEVFETAVPAAQPAPGAGQTPENAAPARGTGALLETAQFAMRDLQRALTQVLTDHRQVTTSLAPVLRELLSAVQIETLEPEARPPVPARFLPLLENPGRAVVVHAPSPTLARLVNSLVESIARLQAVLPLDAVPRAESLAGAEHAVVPTAALPPATTRLLQTLVEALADLVTLLPLADRPLPAGQPLSAAQPLQNLDRALSQAIAVLHEVLPATAAPAPIEPSHTPALPQSTPSPRLDNAVEQVIRLVHELLIPQSPAVAERLAAELPSPPPASQAEPSRSSAASQAEPSRSAAASQAEASRSPVASHTEVAQALAPSRAVGTPALAPRLAEVPVTVAAGLAGVPPSLVASLAAVVAALKADLAPGVVEAGADDSAALVTATLLAELEAATAVNPGAAGTSVPLGSQLETVDAYRWGLLVGLNYRPALSRPAQARLSSVRPRCETCSRLLVQTRSGALVCPTC